MKHIISTLVLALPLAMAAQTPILVNTFPNPTPAEFEFFGWAMAPLGNDRVLVGAPYVGTSGIQNDGTNKTLLVNPTNHSGLYRLIIP